jgi:hypothetical protein
VETSEGSGESMVEGKARQERWVEAVMYMSLVARVNETLRL